jgi:uncharacterized protein (DUF302 family)
MVFLSDNARSYFTVFRVKNKQRSDLNSTECSYGFGCNVSSGFEEAINKVKVPLKEEGFQIYTRLNLHERVGSSAHDKFGRYILIGACNPEFAQQPFYADPNIGLLMPCNIGIYELKSNNQSPGQNHGQDLQLYCYRNLD